MYVAIFISNTAAQLRPSRKPEMGSQKELTNLRRGRRWLRKHLLLVILGCFLLKVVGVELYSANTCIMVDSNPDTESALVVTVLLLASIGETLVVCFVSFKYVIGDKAHTVT